MLERVKDDVDAHVAEIETAVVEQAEVREHSGLPSTCSWDSHRRRGILGNLYTKKCSGTASESATNSHLPASKSRLILTALPATSATNGAGKPRPRCIGHGAACASPLCV